MKSIRALCLALTLIGALAVGCKGGGVAGVKIDPKKEACKTGCGEAKDQCVTKCSEEVDQDACKIACEATREKCVKECDES